MPRKSIASLVTPIRAHGAASPPRPRPDAPDAVRRVFLDLLAAVPIGHFQAADGPLLEQHSQAILLANLAYSELMSGGPVVNGRPSPWLWFWKKRIDLPLRCLGA